MRFLPHPPASQVSMYDSGQMLPPSFLFAVAGAKHRFFVGGGPHCVRAARTKHARRRLRSRASMIGLERGFAKDCSVLSWSLLYTYL